MCSFSDGVGYVAFGLSSDNAMGDDSVIECKAEGGNILAYTSWNTVLPRYYNTREGVVNHVLCVHFF